MRPSLWGCALLICATLACSSKKSGESAAEEQGVAVLEPAAPSLVAAPPPAGAGAFAGHLSRSTDGMLLSWLEPLPAGGVDAAGYRLQVARFAAGHWGPATTVTQGAGIFGNWADVPTVTQSGDGALVAHWPARSSDAAYSYDVALARSTDQGATWNPIGLAHDDGTESEHGFVSMVATERGARAFWLDGRATGAGPGHSGAMALRTALVGQTVTAAEAVDARVCDCCGTDAARTDSGVVVVYRDRSEDELRDIWIARLGPNGWVEPKPVHVDGWRVRGCPVNGPAVAADGADLVVAWFTNANHEPRVRVAFSRDGGASFAEPIDVELPSGRAMPMGRVDVVLHRGDAVISSVATSALEREDAGIWLRRVSPSGTVGAPFRAAVTDPARSAGFPQLELLGDDLLLVWTDVSGPATRLRAGIVAAESLTLAPALEPAVAPGSTLEPSLALGAMAPPFAVHELSGRAVSLAELRGKPVLLNLWATWCEPCRRELPELAALYLRHRDAGLQVVAVSVDRDADAAELAAFVRRRKLPFTVWRDPLDRASSIFGVGVLPRTLLFDRAGRLQWRSKDLVSASDEALAAAIAAALER